MRFFLLEMSRPHALFLKLPLLATLATLAAAGLVAACAPIALINGMVPSDTYTRHANNAYGADERQRLDVYVPARATGRVPVVVFFYGGSWRTGSRGDYLFVGEALASRGFLAVIADYRLYPDVKFPAFVDDAALAVKWAHDNAARFGGDPQALFVMGHSAGAYNAAMVAFNDGYLRRAGAPGGAPRGFIGLAGPYDFLPLDSNLLKNIFGYPDTPPETQPINFVGRNAPPTLLLIATSDTIVRPGNSERLAARIRAAGGSVREVGYDKLDHRTLVGALAAPLRDLAPVLDEVDRFVRQQSAM